MFVALFLWKLHFFSQHFMLEWVLHLINGAVWFANGLIMFLTAATTQLPATRGCLIYDQVGSPNAPRSSPKSQLIDYNDYMYVDGGSRLPMVTLFFPWTWRNVEEGSNHRRFKHTARLQCLQICCSAEFMIAGTSKWIEYCIALIAW